jgi:hypothetical protein
MNYLNTKESIKKIIKERIVTNLTIQGESMVFPDKTQKSIFKKSKMSKDVLLESIDFDCEVIAGAINFDYNITFKNCTFNNPVIFHGTNFEKRVSFEYCNFKDIVDFSSTYFLDEVNFRCCTFIDTLSFESAQFNSIFNFEQNLLKKGTNLLANRDQPNRALFNKPYNILDNKGLLDLNCHI